MSTPTRKNQKLPVEVETAILTSLISPSQSPAFFKLQVNRCPELYGAANSARRKSVYNRKAWLISKREKFPSEFRKICADSGLVYTEQDEQRQSLFANNDDEETDEESSVLEPDTSSMSHLLQSPTRVASDHDEATVVCTLNFTRPEANPEGIFSFLSKGVVIDDEEVVDLVVISMPLYDLLDAKGANRITAKLMKDGVGVEITKPVTSYMLSSVADIYQDEDDSTSFVLRDHLVAANQIKRNPTRQMKKVVCFFPKGTKCRKVQYFSANEENKMKTKLSIIKGTEFGTGANKKQYYTSVVSWRLVVEDEKRLIKLEPKSDDDEDINDACKQHDQFVPRRQMKLMDIDTNGWVSIEPPGISPTAAIDCTAIIIDPIPSNDGEEFHFVASHDPHQPYAPLLQRHEPWGEDFVSSPENAVAIVPSGPRFPGHDSAYFEPVANTSQMITFAPVADPARMIPDYREADPGIFKDSNKRVRIETFTEVMDQDDSDL